MLLWLRGIALNVSQCVTVILVISILVSSPLIWDTYLCFGMVNILGQELPRAPATNCFECNKTVLTLLYADRSTGFVMTTALTSDWVTSQQCDSDVLVQHE
jgi:hypothetical protein